MTGFMGLTFSAFALLVVWPFLWAERSITDGWHWKFYIHDGLHIGYQKKKTYHRGHSVERLFTFRWACAYRYDNSERGGRR